MQLNIQFTKKIALIFEFLVLELMFNYELLTHIKSILKNVTSHFHKIVKTSINNIEKSLKSVIRITKQFIRSHISL